MKRSSSDYHLFQSRPKHKRQQLVSSNSPGNAANFNSGAGKHATVEELLSTRTLASAHLLAVARLPLDILSTPWKEGKNRSVDESHVNSLCKSFINKGLGRLDQENYMKVTCSAQAVAAIKARIRRNPGLAGNPAAEPTSEPLDFRAWAEVTNELPELLDGQHRLRAAQKALGTSSKDNRWWTCEIYDKGMINYYPGGEAATGLPHYSTNLRAVHFPQTLFQARCGFNFA